VAFEATECGGMENVKLLTLGHVVPQVVLSILHAREMGLRVPIVYNTNAFDDLETLELLDGVVDVYSPDFVIWTKAVSPWLLQAAGYDKVAKESVRKLWEWVGDLCFTSDRTAKWDVLFRHRVMPGEEDEAREIMRWLAGNVSRVLLINNMEQCRPDAHVGKVPQSAKGAASSGFVEGTEVNEP